MRNLTYYATQYAGGETTLPAGDVIWFQDPDGEGDVCLNGPAIAALIADAQLNAKLIGEALDAEAIRRQWCGEYQDFVRRMNLNLPFPLPQPQQNHELIVDLRVRYRVIVRAPGRTSGDQLMDMHEDIVGAERIQRQSEQIARAFGAQYVEHFVEYVNSDGLDG